MAFAGKSATLIRSTRKSPASTRTSAASRVTHVDAQAAGDADAQANADWCVCTIPLSILSQIRVNVGDRDAGRDPRRAVRGHRSRSACSSSAASGKRTSASTAASATPTCRSRQIGYPSTGLNQRRQGRAARRLHLWRRQRIRIHRDAAGRTRRARRSNSARRSIRNTGRNSRTALPSPGIACRSHSAASATGPTSARDKHYENLCQIDGRIVLAGEHASHIPAWQEGAILSSLDAITRLHDRVVKT